MRKLRTTAQSTGRMSDVAVRSAQLFQITLLVIAAILAVCSSPARAQPQQIINYGQLAVTGYSGATAVAPPEGADPFDYLRIKLDGPSARVVEVRVLGPQGQLSNATKPFTVTAGQVGQVFGVTLDNATPPNIYVAATSAYGLNIAVVDQNAQQKRVRKGAPGAQWLAGQFGPPGFGGGPGSVWKIDGTTGAVSLFANVQNAMLGAASLGGLAFDPRTRQIFAVDRSTGIVHRFGLDGVQRGTYDHGIEGRGPAGLAPMPQPPGVPVNITSPAFDTENPTTWGFALPARRVNAVTVLGDRLFYSLPQQVWSVGISASGAVAASPRVEVEVPALQDGVEIASIAFDPQGRMYLAERGATTGDYFRYNLANGGAARVLRYVRKLPGDPAPGLWRLTPDLYSVGLAPNYANAQGGVALGFAYNQDNVIDFNSCGPTLWSTGERLLDPGDPAAPPDSFPNIDGLQANATRLVQPQHTPPLQSWFVDYDDLNGDANYRGHMGAVATLPCPGAPAVLPPPPPPPPAPPPVTCPPGTYFANGQCLIVPTCPPNTYYSNGKCYYDDCPPGFYFDNGQCKPIPVPCPPGTFYYKGQCIPIGCPPGMIKMPNGQCKCPPGEIFFQGQCVPPQNCPPGMIELPGGICWCPLGTIFDDGLCKPGSCPPGQVWKNGFCQPCANNEIIKNGQCKPCPPGQKKQGNKCVPICPPHLVFDNGQCKPCPLGQVAVNGVCVDQPCPNGQVPWKGNCVPKCPMGEIHQEPNGVCGPPDIVQPCPANQEMWKGQCVPKCPFNQVHKEPNGACGPLDEVQPCAANQDLWKGQCVPKCPLNQVHKEPDGKCGPFGEVQPCPANQELWKGACVDKCPPLQKRNPDGTCGLPEIIDVVCFPPKVKFNGQCLDPCPPLQLRKPDGTCGPAEIIDVVCSPPKEKVGDKCLDPCPPLSSRQPDGTCKGPKLPDFKVPGLPQLPPGGQFPLQPTPPPQPPEPPPPGPQPPPLVNPDIKLPVQPGLPEVIAPPQQPDAPPPPPPAQETPGGVKPPVLSPDIKLPAFPGLINPPVQPQPPPEPPAQPQPKQTPPPATLTPVIPNVPAIITPAPSSPPPPATPPSEIAPETSSPPPPENPPTKVAPNPNLRPEVLRRLQQRRNAPQQDEGSEEKDEDATTEPETPQQTTPQTLQTVPNRRLQLQNRAPVQ